MRKLVTWLFVGLGWALAFGQSLTLDDLYPRRSYFGRPATNLEWSFDDRYLAYCWNPYDVKGGPNLWIFDTKT